jgi:hypothetical protein
MSRDCSDVAVLRDDETDSARLTCAVPDHRPMSSPVVLIADSTKATYVADGIAHSKYRGRNGRRQDLYAESEN